ncbi:MAG TPA: TetR/AcrR family transcriptional regulator [Caulobacter sp.]|nr:TetR/AcrR family transcriptional regulator [Caulobacter sp.]
MNIADPPAGRRPYRQGARALAAEATAERILQAFMARLREQWFEEITLEAVAQDAEVTLQTVIRRFGGKPGLLEAATLRLNDEIIARRGVPAGDIDAAVEVLAEDYEAVGDFVWRIVAQERRYPALQTVTKVGRSEHRAWLAAVFAPALEGLSPDRARVRLDGLVAATDLYLWVLIRRDMGRPLEAFRTHARALIRAVLADAPPPYPET